MSIARGYAVFANGGYLVDPYFIKRVVDARGTVVFAESPLVVCKGCNDDEVPETVEAEIIEQAEPSFRPLQLDDEDYLEVVKQEQQIAVSLPYFFSI